MRARHALVVGGTGMLQGVVLHLVQSFDRITVIARRRAGLAALEEVAPGVIEGCALDYRDTAALRAAVAELRPLDLAVCWIHATAPDAPDVVAESGAPSLLVHVLGSAAADPSAPADERRARLEAHPKLVYREAILGFVCDGGRSRWLTNREISEGVIAAIESERPRTIVGTVEPWSARP